MIVYNGVNVGVGILTITLGKSQSKNIYPVLFTGVDGLPIRYVFTNSEMKKFNKVVLNIDPSPFFGKLSECAIGNVIGCLTCIQCGPIASLFVIPRQVLVDAHKRSAKYPTPLKVVVLQNSYDNFFAKKIKPY